jgi:hypothetical protein
VFTNIGYSNPTAREVSWAIWLLGIDGGAVSDNYIIHQKDANIKNTFGIMIEDDHRDTTYSNNIIYRLFSGVGLYIDSADIMLLSFSANKIQMPGDFDWIINATNDPSGKMTFSDNVYHSDGTADSRYLLEGKTKTLSEWQAATGDNSTFSEAVLPEPTRDIDTYQQSIGRTPTIAAFISACRQQDRYSWDVRYTTKVVNDWIKAGFSSKDGSESPSLSPPTNLSIVN